MVIEDSSGTSFGEQEVVVVEPYGRIVIVADIDKESQLLTVQRPAGLTWQVSASDCRPATASEQHEWEMAARLHKGRAGAPVPGCRVCGVLNLAVQRKAARREPADWEEEELASHLRSAHPDQQRDTPDSQSSASPDASSEAGALPPTTTK